jgi:negative regulator of flagellin synthesis FlgM
MPIDLRPVTSKAIDPVTGKPASPHTSAPQRTDGRTESDSVALTDAAARLKQAQKALANTAVIDIELVTRVANQLAAGTYEIDAEHIAEKIIEMERQLSMKEDQ